MTSALLALTIAVSTSAVAADPVGVPPGPASVEADAVSYVVIVANNGSFDGSRQTLRFADDDGVRYRELLQLGARRVRLFTVLDAETQTQFPEVVAEAEPPSRAAVMAGLKETFDEIRVDIEAGREVGFYFLYSGHGDVSDDGEGYVHLLDQPLTRRDLFEEVIAASPATHNHIIIDACHSYFMVAGRGAQAEPAGDFGELIRGYVARERLERHPNTGVVVSTASAAEVHEWGRLQAGVFSHELRSAIAGAADVNGDGAVDYREVGAFFAAANGALPNSKARITAFVQAPARNLSAPLARVPLQTASVRVPAQWQGRFHIEDDRGLRYADFNKAAGHALELRLAPRPRYYLRGGEREHVIEPAQLGSIFELDAVESRPLVVASRGASHDLFDEYLFAIPFGPAFVSGFEQARLQAPAEPARPAIDMTVVSEPASLAPWAAALGVVSVGLAGGAVGLGVMAQDDAAAYSRAAAGSSADIEAIGRRARAENNAAWALGAASVATAVGAASVLLFDWLAEE